MRLYMRYALALVASVAVALPAMAGPTHSVARDWNELLLESIRKDFARPTVHARNLFHSSVAMYDAWAIYDTTASTYLTHERRVSGTPELDRHETLSYAMYRILRHRFATSPGAAVMYPQYDALMLSYGYDTAITTEAGLTPAALGNRIATNVLRYGLNDNSNEIFDYANQVYLPINDPLVPGLPGNPDMVDPQRWQPLALDFFVDQGGNVIVGGFPEALSPEWGQVWAFALKPEDRSINQRDGYDWWMYHDPGPPPVLGGATDFEYKDGFEEVLEFSSKLDPSTGVMIDISPASRGNSTVGTNDGTGYAMNPVLGTPYATNSVPEGDYFRVLAEFWADGPDSETPPGHWVDIANYVTDELVAGSPILPPAKGVMPPIAAAPGSLEWDVKMYFAMSGAMHDSAVTAWGVKGWYDFLRPISAVRYMGELGQCTDMGHPTYDPNGINLIPGVIELITPASSAPGERHQLLAPWVGDIAVQAWRGPDYIPDPETFTAGVGWIRLANWWPYQRPSFVTPPFPGYVSGHSTYSRAAAELLTAFTGSPWFPNGKGTFFAEMNEYLVFEEGPSVDVTLEWASYYDAADESGLSRLYGGIHPRADDFPGRLMGQEVGIDAFDYAETFFDGTQPVPCKGDSAPALEHGRYGDGDIDIDDLLAVIQNFGTCESFEICPWDVAPVQPDGLTGNGQTNIDDLLYIINNFGTCP
ncbi:MAG: vanadium-dependent haloperoxidase [Planctomycetota bacterium]